MREPGGVELAVAPRVTEQVRSVETRARILDAAVEALVVGGYAGASTLRIQEIAGVSRGRLLHHYPSRDDLLVAAVHHLAEVRIAGLARRDDWPDARAARIDAVVAEMWSTYRQPYFWASTELWLAARHNHRLAEALLPNERRIADVMRASIVRMFGAEIAGHPEFGATVEVLNSSMRGVALSYAITPGRDPGTDPHLLEWRAIARGRLGA